MNSAKDDRIPMSQRPLTRNDPGQFELYCHSSPATVYPEETHATIQICIPLENALYDVIRQSETGRRVVHHLGSRDVLALPIGQPHSVMWRRQADIVSFHMSEDFIAHALGVGRLQLADTFTVRDPFISAAAAELRSSLKVAGRLSPIFAEAIATLVAYRIGLCARQHTGIRTAARAAAFTGRELIRIERYIEDRLHQCITVSMLADLTGLSLWHFMRRFNASRGLSLHGYITQRRLLRARKLLADTDLSVVRIALETGMTHSHLSRSFSRQFGIAPREFRRQQRK
jgi:AraC family transcriptional regulator